MAFGQAGIRSQTPPVAPVNPVGPERNPEVDVFEKRDVEAPRTEVLSVWLSNGIALEVPAGFDDVELRRLVGLLSTC